MKIRSLVLMAVMLISGAIFSGFYLTQLGQEKLKTVLTVESDDPGKSISFDIAIIKDQGEKLDFKMLEN